jgi:hypothetical protein
MKNLKALLVSVLFSSGLACAGDVKPINPGLLPAPLVAKEIQEVINSKSSTQDAAEKKAILKQLPNSDTFVYVLDAATSAKLGLAFLTGDAAEHTSTVIQEYILYRDQFDSANNKTVRIGLGVRLFITANEDSGKIGTLSIPAITALAEARKLQATVRLQTMGISSQAITSAIKMPVELTFSTLMQLYQTIDTIKGGIWDANTFITPQVIGMSGPAASGHQ